MAGRRGFNKPGRGRARSGLRSQVSVLATTEEAEEVAKPRAMAMELEGAAAMAEDREGVGWNTEESDEDVQGCENLGARPKRDKEGSRKARWSAEPPSLQPCAGGHSGQPSAHIFLEAPVAIGNGPTRQFELIDSDEGIRLPCHQMRIRHSSHVLLPILLTELTNLRCDLLWSRLPELAVPGEEGGAVPRLDTVPVGCTVERRALMDGV
ncbi:unnamed protein product [Pleuronectes platessa]|uniref:Uncharacterized protein n=1 Tax=Pleuronectes platessa TaxID=8262 RepID=A0A9N7V2T6_PLEPL|nr:unnamed protein product [Pleuronectes platessa]